MMKSQAPLVPPSRWRRFFGWFGRHKVLAVFTVLVVAGALFFAYLDVSYRLQVHFEHERFNNAAVKINQIGNDFRLKGTPNVLFTKNCTHSNFGIVFGTDTIFCDSRVVITYQSIPSEGTLTLVQRSRKILSNRGITMTKSPYDNDPSSLGSFNFTYQGFKCSLDTDYYPKDGSYDLGIRYKEMTFLADIDCGGRALQDYFPVVKD